MMKMLVNLARWIVWAALRVGRIIPKATRSTKESTGRYRPHGVNYYKSPSPDKYLPSGQIRSFNGGVEPEDVFGSPVLMIHGNVDIQSSSACCGATARINLKTDEIPKADA